ncbi:MAG TPA: hypothetical protein VLL08_06525 [Kineosporiaceae bacterium]|nr:hypothetical protein [Kineosporiaceae bacterium]
MVRAGRTLAISAFCIVAAGVAPVFLPASPLVVAGVTIVADGLLALIDFASTVREDDRNSPISGRGSSMAGAASLAVVLVVIVAAGGGAAYAVSYGVARLTGHETVTSQRLSKHVSGRAGPLRVTVNSVGTTDHYTKVEMVAVNRGDATVRVQLMDATQLIDKSGNVLDPLLGFSEDGTFVVPSGGIQVKRILTFKGHLVAKSTTATLAFNTLYWQGFGPTSLKVKNIKLLAAG